jgi:hypothetical protein
VRHSPIGENRQFYSSSIAVFSECYSWQLVCTPNRERGRIDDQERGKMLRIRRSANREVVFSLSGRMGLEETVELETLIKSEENGRPIVLDLKDVTLVGRDAIAFLERCEADSITLKNCAGYVREWITRQRESS